LIVLLLAGLGFLAFAGIIGKGARTVYPPHVDGQWNQRPNAAVDAGGMGFGHVLPTLLIHQVPISFGAAGPFVAVAALAGLLAASVGAAAVNLRAIGLLLALDVPLAFGRPASRGVGMEWASRILATSVAIAATWLVVADHRPGTFRPLALAAEVIILGPAFLLQLLPATIDCLYLGRGSRGGAATGLLAGIVVVGGFSPLVAFVVERIVPAAGPWLVRLAEHFDPALTALTANVSTFVVVSLFAKVKCAPGIGPGA
jgi:Na+/proline symporter